MAYSTTRTPRTYGGFGARLWGVVTISEAKDPPARRAGSAWTSRLMGSFRAHGLLVPVWDLPVGTSAEALEAPAAGFAQRLAAALDDASPLSMGPTSGPGWPTAR